jgi:hypothetical protein
MSTRLAKRGRCSLGLEAIDGESTDRAEALQAGHVDSPLEHRAEFDSAAATRPEHHSSEGNSSAPATNSLPISESELPMDESARDVADDPMNDAMPY